MGALPCSTSDRRRRGQRALPAERSRHRRQRACAWRAPRLPAAAAAGRGRWVAGGRAAIHFRGACAIVYTRRRSRRPSADTMAIAGAGQGAGRDAGARTPRGGRRRWRTLSYTSFSELERCGYRYYLERVLGLPEDRQAASRRRPARGPRGARPGHARPPADGVARLRAAGFDRAASDVARCARELGMRVGARRARRDRAADRRRERRAAGGARVAAATAVRREHPFAFSAGAAGAADHRRDRPARERAPTANSWCSTTRATGRRGRRSGGAGRARLRDPAPAVRAGGAARRRGATWRSCTGSWNARASG